MGSQVVDIDTSGLESAFYINVQVGEVSVVQPDPGVTSDQIIYYYDRPGRPSVFVAHSNVTMEGVNVLTDAQLYELGQALDAIRTFFAPAYGSTSQWWAMDTEFKAVTLNIRKQLAGNCISFRYQIKGGLETQLPVELHQIVASIMTSLGIHIVCKHKGEFFSIWPTIPTLRWVA